MTIDDIKAIVSPLARRISNAFARGTVTNTDPSTGKQRLQIHALGDEVLDQVEHIQQYGLASNPMPGAETVVVFLGGSREQGIAIATDDSRYRPKGLAPGEVCVYNTAGASPCYILLQADGSIVIKAATQVKVIGADVVADGISLKHHTHTDPQGGVTGQPIG